MKASAWIIVAAMLLAALPAAAQTGSAPPAPAAIDSVECRTARAQLDTATAAATGRSDATAAALRSARERAARDCFGRGGDVQGLRAPAPAVRVPSTSPSTAPGAGSYARPSALSSPTLAPPPVAVPRAGLITQCDATGCWDSNGQRLNRVGPLLNGPGGPCTVQGSSAVCP